MKNTITNIKVEDIEKRHFPDKHYEYVIRVSWSDGRVNVVYRRYSRFYALQCKLLDHFPADGGIYNPSDRTLPFLPGKILFGRSHIRKVALNRLDPINEYCKKLIHLPSKISECKDVLQFFDTSEEDLLPANQNSESSSEVQGESISDPILLDEYTVVADYDKDGRNETSLQAGWVVDVVEKNETGWWFVRTDVGQGWVPSSYLERTDGSEDDRVLQNRRGSKFVVTHSYLPQETDEIKLDKGCYVEVIERNLDGWWVVRYKGSEGRAPASYLTRTDTLKVRRLMKQERTSGVQIVPNLRAVTTFENLRKGEENRSTSAESKETTFKNTPFESSSQIGKGNVKQFPGFSKDKETFAGRFQGHNNFPAGARPKVASNNNNTHFNSNGKNLFERQNGKIDLNQNVNNDKFAAKLNNINTQVQQQNMVTRLGAVQHLPTIQTSQVRVNSTIAMKMDLKQSSPQTQQDLPQTADTGDVPSDDDIDYENVEKPFQPPHGNQATGYQSDTTTDSESSFDSMSIGSSETSDSSPWRQNKLPPRRETLTRGMAPPKATESIYIVVADFKNTVGDGINVYLGEEVTVLEQTDQGWWMVRGLGGEGWAPSAYIEKREQLPTKVKPSRPQPPLQGRKWSQPTINVSNQQQQGQATNPDPTIQPLSQGRKWSQPTISVSNQQEFRRPSDPMVQQYGKQAVSNVGSPPSSNQQVTYGKQNASNSAVVSELSNVFGNLKKTNVNNSAGVKTQSNYPRAVNSSDSSQVSAGNSHLNSKYNPQFRNHSNKPIVKHDTKPVMHSSNKPIVPLNTKPQLPGKPKPQVIGQKPQPIKSNVTTNASNSQPSVTSVSNIKKMFEQ